MAENSKISWTDHTFNPWWGCTHSGPGCDHCYASAFAARFGVAWGKSAPRKFFGGEHWKEPLRWNRKAERAGIRARVFCASMGDVCEGRPDLIEPRRRLEQVIDDTPHLTWILLSKRPEHYNSLFSRDTLSRCVVGTTAENQEMLEERWPHLARVPAAIRWVSVEPCLGPVTLKCNGCAEDVQSHLSPDQGGCSGWFPDWIVVGAESGPGRRPCKIEWIESIVEQCTRAGVPVHVKQLSLDGRISHDMSEWPEALRIRQYPERADA